MAYANGMAPLEALVPFEGVLLTPDMYRRCTWAFAEYRRLGGTIKANQGYRFRGTLKDYEVGFNDRSEDESGAKNTSDGTANQQYQRGRAALYKATGGKFGTPSAATVGTSNHGDWLIGALDCNASDTPLRDRVFAVVGLARTVRGETWHYANVGAPTIDLSGIPLPGENPPTTPERKATEIMANTISIHNQADNTWLIFTPFELRPVDEAYARNLAKAQDDFVLELQGDQINTYRQQVDYNLANDPVLKQLEQLTALPDVKKGFASQINDEYRAVLGRDADGPGLAMFLGFMVDLDWTIQQVHDDLLRSDEYAERLIASLYVKYLGRTAGPTEIAGWVSWAHVNGLGGVEPQIAGSDEAKQHAAGK